MSMNENCLCVLVVTKTAKVSVSVSVSVSGVGLGLDHAGLGLVLVSDSLVLITSLDSTTVTRYLLDYLSPPYHIYVQNAAARLVTQLRPRDYVTDDVCSSLVTSGVSHYI